MINRRWACRLLVIVISVVSLGGCSWFVKQPSLHEGYLIPYNEPPSKKQISRLVYLVADNQLHNLYGEPVPLFRTTLADKIVQTAIRSVQLDFYGQDFLKWVVVDKGRRYQIVHLGDACDFSCTGEFKRFWEIMSHAKKAWVMAPGNHDSYFFGNDHRSVDKGDWTAACMNAGSPLTKDVFVRLYLAALVLQQGSDKPGYQALARELDLKGLDHADLEHVSSAILNEDLNQGDLRFEAEGRPFLSAISWKIDREKPWRSFVVQEVDMSFDIPVRAIILDTSQYDEKPALLPLSRNAGVTGELLNDQIDIVKSWIESNTDQDRVWVLIGHLPFDSLSKKAQKAVDDLRKRAKVPLYVSAHTHDGEFIVHGKGTDVWLELNVGSILDWPQEVREFQIRRVGERLMLRSQRGTMRELLGDKGIPDQDDIWEAKPGDADYYLRHEDLADLSAEKTEIQLKDTLLAAHHRLLRFNPTQLETGPKVHFWPPGCKSDKDVLAKIDRVIEDDQLDKKIEFLIELDRFERDRPVKDIEKRKKYRLSQAIWAGWYDYAHAREPREDDWYIIFPAENKKKE